MIDEKIAALNVPKVVHEMFAFLCIDPATGDEAVPATTFGGEVEMAMPLMGSDMARIGDLRPIAQSIANSTGVPVRLVKFTCRVELEVINAGKLPGVKGRW